MLKKRLIARLDVKAPNLVRRVRFEGLRVIGDPASYAERYDTAGIDEIIYVDCVASLYGRNNLKEILERTAEHVFCPITVAGGIRSVSDVKSLLDAGADRVAVNTAATFRPELISEIAEKYGSQCVALQIDAKKVPGGWEAWRDGGREKTGFGVVEWAQRGAQLGAGEILLTSIDREGTGKGLDVDLVQSVSCRLSVPVVASGGVGSVPDVVNGFRCGADGIALANTLHYGSLDLTEIRKAVSQAGFPVR